MESYLHWMIRTTGLVGILTFLVGVVAFFGECVVVFLFRRPIAVKYYCIFPLLPLLVNILGALLRCLTDQLIIVMSDADMQTSYISTTVPDILRMLEDGVLATVPVAFIAGIGLITRTRKH
jgi:hypothetical protein